MLTHDARAGVHAYACWRARARDSTHVHKSKPPPGVGRECAHTLAHLCTCVCTWKRTQTRAVPCSHSFTPGHGSHVPIKTCMHSTVDASGTAAN
eukprot:5066300-Pleurochrysis_carterae.AAC.1